MGRGRAAEIVARRARPRREASGDPRDGSRTPSRGPRPAFPRRSPLARPASASRRDDRRRNRKRTASDIRRLLLGRRRGVDRGHLRRDVQRQERRAHPPGSSRDHREKESSGVQVTPRRAVLRHLPHLEPRRPNCRGGAGRYVRADRAGSSCRTRRSSRSTKRSFSTRALSSS